jgi:hypothetical protein
MGEGRVIVFVVEERGARVHARESKSFLSDWAAFGPSLRYLPDYRTPLI